MSTYTAPSGIFQYNILFGKRVSSPDKNETTETTFVLEDAVSLTFTTQHTQDTESFATTSRIIEELTLVHQPTSTRTGPARPPGTLSR